MSRHRECCANCGRAGNLRRIDFRGRPLMACERCRGRIVAALAGHPDLAYLLRALERKVR